MDLTPLNRNMRLFARRVINLGNARLLPGQEFRPIPRHRGALSWRMITIMYKQRRLISENDPYFEELMRGPGMKNNPEFAQAWLDAQRAAYPEEPIVEPVAKPQIGGMIETEPDIEPDGTPSKAEVMPVAPGWYDVIADGEKLNEKSLRKAEAEEMAGMYNG